MVIAVPKRRPATILQMTAGLSLFVILSSAVSFLGLALLHRLPPDEPISAYEVARLLDGRAIGAMEGDIQVRTTDVAPPGVSARTRDQLLVREAIKSYLRPNRALVFRSDRPEPGNPGIDLDDEPAVAKGPTRIERQHALYGADGHFDPSIPNSFSAGVQLPDGRWRLVSRVVVDPYAT